MKIEQRFLSPESGWRAGSTSLAGEAPQLAFVIGPRALLENPVHVNRVRETYPRTQLVFVSGAGAFAGATTSDDQLIVTAIALEKSSVRAVVRTVRDRAQSAAVGRDLGRQLCAPDLVHVFVFSDGIGVNGSRLTDGLNEVLPVSASVSGGLAGDGTAFGRTVVGLDGHIGPDRVVAVGLYGPHVRVGHGCRAGWVPYGVDHVATHAEDNMLFEIDGRPALQVYRHQVDAAAMGAPATALRYPLHMTPLDGGATVVRTCHSMDEETGIMEFAGDIVPGARLRFLRAAAQDLIGGAVQAARDAQDADPPELVWCVNCVARRLVLGADAPAEMAQVQAVFGTAVPFAGFYSYGEIAPSEGAEGCQFHNQTMTITTLREV